MLTPTARIQIGNMVFHGLNELRVLRSVENLSATGRITLPRLAVFDSKLRSILAVSKEVKVTDPVTVEVGYMEDALNTIFKGYVTAVNPDVRVAIDIEDAMFLLRREPIVKSVKKIKLRALLGEMLSGTEVSLSDRTADMMIDEFQYSGNVAGAIAKLKEVLKLTVYINEDNMLYAGGQSLEMLPPDKRKHATINLTYGRNIIDNKVEYQTAESKPLKVIVKGKTKDGKQIIATAGIDGGTHMRYNVSAKATLQKIAEELYAQQSYDGFRGTLTTMGLPKATIGGTVNYKNDNYTEQEGRYFIKAVDTTLSSGGLRQKLTLGYKI